MPVSELVSNDGKHTPAHERLASLYGRMGDEINEVVESERKAQALLKDVQRELSISKRAFASIEAENEMLRQEKEALERQRDDLLNQLKPCRIVVLIDGDGAIFNVDLIAEGRTGGHKAASMLSEAVKQQYPGRPHLEILVYVFLNQYGLAAKFGRISKYEAKSKLGEFMTGFNQASERYVIADVGFAKEGADAKIKAFLDAELRLPQTEKIIFGGCHDNGYVTALRSHITSGSKQKLMLLQSYDTIAAGIRDLDLPVLLIPGLFMAGNLDTLQTPSLGSTDLPLSSSTPNIPDSVPPTPRRRGLSRARSERSEASRPRDVSRSRSETSESVVEEAVPSPTPDTKETRPINRSLALWAQRPAACLVHYLAPTKCKHNPCNFEHTYQFTAAEIEILRKRALSVPCTAIQRGFKCSWGDSCVYGHKCPSLDKCRFLKTGKCRFKGPTMHLPDDSASEV